MKTRTILKLSMLTLAITAATNASANVNEKISKAVKETKVDVSLRYRFETVDQDGVDEEALASTLKSRLTLTTGKIANFGAKVEADNVTYIGSDNFNNTVNGKTDHAVVADPDGSEINQAFLQYTNKILNVTAGRQRINLDDQRFVGGVAWRQNEQTFDGYRVQLAPASIFNFDLSYVYNVNRIFGEDSAKSDLHGDIVLANAKYKFANKQSVSVYNYYLDFDGGAASTSSNTIGITYNGAFPIAKNTLAVKLGYADQEEVGDTAMSYSADYSVIDAQYKFKGYSVGAGIETLGSDGGDIGFATPLATLHKFQGFTDKFLTTPIDGLVDTYIKGSAKIGPVNVAAAYHMFEADSGNNDYGNEINITATYKLNKQVSALVKAASYSEDDGGYTDTNKLWFMVTANY
ncbi:porin [Colwelliaceae bacterium BS250]